MSGDAIAGVLASRRLGRGAAPRQAFTVETTEARLRLRQRPGAEPWSWTLVLVRALLALTDAVEVTGETVAREDVHELVLELAFDPDVVRGLELGLLFDAAIEPDPGPGDGSLARRQLRLRRLLARALNEALAAGPRSLTLETDLGSRSFVRREGAGDPYVERMGPPRGRAGLWVVRIAVERTVSRWFDALVFGKDGLFGAVRTLWAARVPGAQLRAGAATLQVPPLEGSVPLGRVARLLPAASQWRGWLVRDGVLVCSIAAVLREQGLPAEAAAVAIECATLQLTLDENTVVKDDALALLTAWLHDASAHATAGQLLSAQWPAEPEPLVDAAGTVVAREGLLALARQDREVTYVWRHEAQTLPLALRDRVLAPWPSQLEALAREAPGLRMVPVRVVAETADEGRLELEPLAQGSLPPWSWTPPPWPRPHGDALAIAAEVYVHRHGVAVQSTTVVAAHDRVLLREPAGKAADDAGLPGVTLVLRLALSSTSQSLARASMRGETGDRAEAAAQLRELVAWGWAQLATQRDALVQHALAVPLDDALRERVPLLAAAIAGVDARVVALSYRDRDGVVALAWREQPLLALRVANARDGSPRSLGDALVRAREVGGLVLGEAARRWFSLELDDGRHDTWIATPSGAELLLRVLGRATLWIMPTVPQGHAHVAPAAAQRQLLLPRDEVARLLGRGGADVAARTALLAHALVAIALGEDTMGLREVPLLPVYDPRAVTPSRLLSIAAMQADGRSFAVVPCGAVDRDLLGPVVEASPGIATLLHEALALPLEPVPDGGRAGGTPPRGGAVADAVRAEPLLRHPIADALAVGALQLGGGAPPGVALWARGLHVGALPLPPPLSDLGGRLWLADAGVRAGRPAIETMLLGHARALVEAARRQAVLAPPGGARRRAIERFVEHCDATAAAGDDRLGLRAPPPRSQPRVLSPQAASAGRLPPLRRTWLPALVRHGLGRPGGFERAWLSWRLVRVSKPEGVVWDLEVGGRHAWIRRALDDESTPTDVELAALAIVAEVLATAAVGETAIAAALLRVLATAHVHARV